MAAIQADRRLCFNSDRSIMVEETDPRAAFLAYPEGRFISAGDVEKYGLKKLDGRVVLSDKAVASAETKVVEQPESKEAGETEEADDGLVDVPDWPLTVSPEDYLARYGDDAKNSALARAVIDAAEG